MPPLPVALVGSYDARLVIVSVAISCIASYAALDLGGRVTSAHGGTRALWLGGGATAMGIGIWSMHYIGMLAFHLPVGVLYDWPTVVLSLLAAIAASAIALFVVSRPKLGLPRAGVGSVFMGAGIATMHYTGMAAMRVAAMCHYSLPIVALSVALAMAISFVALWLTFHLRGGVPAWGWKKIASASVMGAAIPVMHYTGMAAASFETAPLSPDALRHAVSVSTLGMTGIVAGTLMVLGLVLLTAMADREFSAQVKGREQAENERRRAEEQLRQAQKMDAVGQLAAGVAHDFNNLLTAIIGFNELTLEDLGPDHPSRPDLEQAILASRSAEALTRQLLAFSRTQILRPEHLDLNAVVRRMEMLLKRTIGERVDIRYRLAASLGTVFADHGQIEQVVLNLVVNARDAMPEGGVITIETTNMDLEDLAVLPHSFASATPHVKLSIEDTGTGMPEFVKSRLFEPFFTTKERGKGTGLGLATVYGIVRQSDGAIWVQSEIGRGTTVSIALPRVEKSVGLPLALSPARQVVGGTETVLLAEDQPEVAAMMRATLTRHGYQVLEARDGPEAMRLAGIHAGVIHLLVTDVVMPGMLGRELASLLIKRLPGLRVLYASGYTDDAIVRHGVIESGLAFIQKPFSPDDLLIKVREVLDDPAGIQTQTTKAP